MQKYQYLQSYTWTCGPAALMCAAAELGIGDLLTLGNEKADAALKTRFPDPVNLSQIFKRLHSQAPIPHTSSSSVPAHVAGSFGSSAPPHSPVESSREASASAGAAFAGPDFVGPASAGSAPAGSPFAGSPFAVAASAGPASMGSTHLSSPRGLPTHIAATRGSSSLDDTSFVPTYTAVPSGLPPLQICKYIEDTIFIATRSRGEFICPNGSWVSGMAYTAFAMGLNVVGIDLAPIVADFESGLPDYKEEKAHLEKRFTVSPIAVHQDFSPLREDSRRLMLVIFPAPNATGLHWIVQRPDNSFMNPGGSMRIVPLQLTHSQLISRTHLLQPLLFKQSTIFYWEYKYQEYNEI